MSTATGLSIILPTYERPDLLSEQLAAIDKQDLAGVREILVGDNSGPEGSERNRAVIEQAACASLVNYRHNVPDLGNYPNQVALGRRATGEYLMLVHDDDRLCDGAVTTLLDIAAKDSGRNEIRVWFGRNLVMSPDGVLDREGSRQFSVEYGKDGPEEIRPIWNWCLHFSLPPNAFVMRTADYQRFCEGPRDGNVGDFRMWVRMANAGYWAHFVPDDMFVYRTSSPGVTNSGRQVDVHLLYEATQELQVPPPAQAQKKSLERRHSEVALRRYLRDGDIRRARELAFSSNSPMLRRPTLGVLASMVGVVSPPAYRVLHRFGGRTEV